MRRLAPIGQLVDLGLRRSRDAHLAIDELEITRALRVAVSSTVLGTSLVVRELGHATVGSHLGEVQSAVETARELRDVDVEGELAVQGVEHVVGRVGVHEVDTRADVLVVAVGDEVQLELVTAGGDTVGTLVVGTVQSALLSARSGIITDGGIPGVALVAVIVSAVCVLQQVSNVLKRNGLPRIMQPAPVSVKYDLSVLLSAAAASTADRPLK